MADKKTAFAVLLLVPLFIFMTTEEGTSSSGSSNFLGKVVNFAVLFGGLTYILYKPLRNFLTKRSRDIRAALDEARDARREAEQKLEEARRRIAALEDEVTGMKREAERKGLKEQAKIKALAEKEAIRIRSFAQQEIDLQLKAGIQELKEYTAEIAASLAEARMKDKITEEGQSKLIDKSIERLAEIHEEPNSR
jgi:F-type H+-transporting ATPase subunit b